MCVLVLEPKFLDQMYPIIFRNLLFVIFSSCFAWFWHKIPVLRTNSGVTCQFCPFELFVSSLPTAVFIHFITTDVYVLVGKHPSDFVKKFSQKVVGGLLCGIDWSIDIYGLSLWILALSKKSRLTSFPRFSVTWKIRVPNHKGFEIQNQILRFNKLICCRKCNWNLFILLSLKALMVL